MVWCTWRLDGPDAPIASSDQEPEQIATSLSDALIGERVVSCEAKPPAWDLSVAFSNALVLQVFCDHIPPAPSFNGNWELVIHDTCLAIGPGYSAKFVRD